MRGRHAVGLIALLLTCACQGQQQGGTGGAAAAREAAACERVQRDKPDQTRAFIDLWATPLLDVSFQRAFTTATELPPQYHPSQFGELTEGEQLGLASCLAQALVELQPDKPPNAPSFTIVGGGGRNVYEESFITDSGSPLYGGSLKTFIFERDTANLADPSLLPPTLEPPPAITAPVPPSAPPVG